MNWLKAITVFVLVTVSLVWYVRANNVIVDQSIPNEAPKGMLVVDCDSPPDWHYGGHFEREMLTNETGGFKNKQGEHNAPFGELCIEVWCKRCKRIQCQRVKNMSLSTGKVETYK